MSRLRSIYARRAIITVIIIKIAKIKSLIKILINLIITLLPKQLLYNKKLKKDA